MNKEQQTRPRLKKITGFHVTLMFIGFFGVIMAVNFFMAALAIGSFSGTVVDNSYVASQKYNEWLAESRAQEAYGWSFDKPTREGNKLQIIALANEIQPLTSATVTAIVGHPVGRSKGFNLSFSEITPGQYQSVQPLPAGRWKLKISILQGERHYKLVDDVQ